MTSDSEPEMIDYLTRSLTDEVRLSDPQVSPDGQTIVVVASRPDFEANRFVKTIELVEIGSGRVRTVMTDVEAPSHPRWSPSGDSIAFLGNRGDQTLQIYLVPLEGGAARKVTSSSMGVHTFAFRPDGHAMAFVAESARDNPSGTERHNRSFEVGDNSYLEDRAPTASYIWLADIDGGSPRRITFGTDCFCKHFGTLSWSPDGRLLAYTSQPRPDSGALVETTIRVLDLESGKSHPVGNAGSVVALFSPSGSELALCRPTSELGFSPGGVQIVDLAGDTMQDVTRDLDRDFLAFGAGKAGMAWTSDGASLVLWANDGVQKSIWLHSREGSARRLELGQVQVSELAVAPNGAIAIVGSTPTKPNELYWIDLPKAQPRCVTAFNVHLQESIDAVRSAFEWGGPDGFAGNGVVTYPPGYSSKKRYPLVLDIHGGPMSASSLGFSHFHWLLARQGWIVLSPNYRGSNNMGAAYQRAVINDAGDGPSRDIMAGVSELVQQAGVDEAKLAVSGWSYGGFLTVWLAAQYDVWKSAVAGAAVSSWIDWYNLSDLNVWCGIGLGGSPWREGGIRHYLSQSAITLAPNVRTPTLLMSTTGDRRVSVTQSHKLFHALKDNGTEVSFVAYPIAGHFPDDPVHERDVYRRWIRWIREHFESQSQT